MMIYKAVIVTDSEASGITKEQWDVLLSREDKPGEFRMIAYGLNEMTTAVIKHDN